jgi:hypothetical protein
MLGFVPQESGSGGYLEGFVFRAGLVPAVEDGEWVKHSE